MLTQQELFTRPAMLTLFKTQGQLKPNAVIMFQNADDLFDYIKRLADMRRYPAYGIRTNLEPNDAN